MLGDLEHQADFVTFNLKGAHNSRKFAIKLDVYDRTDDLCDFPCRRCSGGSKSSAGARACLSQIRDRPGKAAPRRREGRASGRGRRKQLAALGRSPDQLLAGKVPHLARVGVDECLS